MSDKMSEEQVHEKLKEMDSPEATLPWLFKITNDVLRQKGKNPTAVTLATLKALRRLAESQQALGEIDSKATAAIGHFELQYRNSHKYGMERLNELLQIARKALGKEEK